MSARHHLCQATGKRCFASKAIAREVVRQLKRKQENASLYPCSSCRGWHVSSMTRAEWRKRVRGLGPAMREAS